MAKQVVSNGILVTTLAIVENILNGRPLTYNGTPMTLQNPYLLQTTRTSQPKHPIRSLQRRGFGIELEMAIRGSPGNELLETMDGRIPPDDRREEKTELKTAKLR